MISGTLLVFGMLEALLGPALVEIQNAVGASAASVTWVFTGLLLSGSVAAPLIGRLADLHDKRKLFLIVLAVVLTGIVIAALATTIVVLAVGQILKGVGLALVPLSLGILRETQPADRVKAGTGLILGVTALGGVAGVLFSGHVVEALSYRWLFWLPFIALALLGLAALRVVPSTAPAPDSAQGGIDWPGAALLTAGLVGLLIALTEVNSWGWTSGRFLALSVPSLFLLAVFVAVELRAEHPLVDLRVGGRSVMIGCAVVAAIGWASSTAQIAVPIMVAAPGMTGYGLESTATLAGYVIAPVGIVAGIMSVLTRRLESYVGGRTLMVTACVCLMASTALILTGPPERWTLAVASGIAGLGVGVGFTQAINLLVTTVPAERVASLSGFVFVVKGLGGILGAQLTGTLLAREVIPGTPLPTWSSVTTAYWMATGVGLLAALLSAALPRRSAPAPAAAPAAPAEV
ncbi:MFS transporter [Streptomyces sp. NPDC055078]